MKCILHLSSITSTPLRRVPHTDLPYAISKPVRGGEIKNRPSPRIQPEATSPGTISSSEWLIHTRNLVDQPDEVMARARAVFHEVLQKHGLVSGVKARALVLVALLFIGRNLHGNNTRNEAYLMRTLSDTLSTHRQCALGSHQTHEPRLYPGRGLLSYPNAPRIALASVPIK